MKDIGYYTGFFTADHQKEIQGYEFHQLCILLALTSQEILDTNDKPKSQKGVKTFLFAAMSELSSLNQISLVRGLCDRIELKLMETAK